MFFIYWLSSDFLNIIYFINSFIFKNVIVIHKDSSGDQRTRPHCFRSLTSASLSLTLRLTLLLNIVSLISVHDIKIIYVNILVSTQIIFSVLVKQLYIFNVKYSKCAFPKLLPIIRYLNILH